MKKILSLVLALALICSLALIAYAANIDVGVSSSRINAGDTLTVTITLEEAIDISKGATMMQGELHYDGSVLEFVSVEKSNQLSNAAKHKKQDKVLFHYLSMDNSAVGFEAGVLATVIFTAKKDISADHVNTVLELKNAYVQNALGQNVGDLTCKSSVSVLVCKEHTWDKGTVTKNPTCTEAGEKIATCTVCGESGAAVVIPATGHTWDEGTVTKDPTCTEAGEKAATCTACGEPGAAVVIPATGHTWDEGKVTTAATCTKKGVKTYTCSACGDSDTEPIDALGHAVNNFTVTKEPTCTEAGEKTGTCSVCGEKNATEEIAPIDHTPVTDAAVPATCTATGLTEGKHCSACNTVLVKQEVLSALGHQDADGDNNCDRCGELMSHKFTDVSGAAYYAEPVAWAVEKGITTGTKDGSTFEPDTDCTRAQIATFLWRAAGSPAPKSTEIPFIDVAAGEYYTDAILWAYERGITSGTKDGTTFEPNATCTRAQIVTMLARYCKGTPGSKDNPFTDVPAGAYYTDAVLWAVENGITTGTKDGTTFEPNATCSRAQIVTFLFRLWEG